MLLKLLIGSSAVALLAGCKSDAGVGPVDTTGGGGGNPPPPPPAVSLVATAPLPVRLAVVNGALFWLDSGVTPLNRIDLTTGGRTVLVRDVPIPERAVSDGSNAFWVAGGQLYRTSLDATVPDGSHTTTLLADGSRDAGSRATPDVVLDATNAYWVNTIASPSCTPACTFTIQSVPKTGGVAKTLTTTQQPIVSLAVADGFVYWEESNVVPVDANGTVGSMIKKVATTGGATTVLVNGLLNGRIAPPAPGFTPASWQPIGGIEADESSVYFADITGSSTSRLMKVPVAGGNVDVLFTETRGSQTNVIRDFVLDASTVYFIDATSLQAVPKGGGASTSLATALASPVSLTRSGTSLFWLETLCCAHGQTGAIKSLGTGGGTPVTIRANIAAPVSLSSDATRLFWTAGGAVGEIEGFGDLTFRSFDGSEEAPLVEAAGGGPFATDGLSVYFANGFTIKRVSAFGGRVERVLIGDAPVRDIALDGAHLYWVEEGAALNIRTRTVAGGAPVTLATGNAPGSLLRLDAAYVYWLDHEDAVRRVPKAGGNPETIVPAIAGGITDFVLDAANVYYAEWDGKRIRKAAVSGGAATTLTTPSNVDQTRRLTTDGASLYWIDQSELNKISVNGGTATTLVRDLDNLPDPPSGIVVDGQSVYWTEVAGFTIKKATPK
jgi:hypothetical protein